MQICRVEDIDVSGLVQGTVINFNRARNVTIQRHGSISATGLGNTSLFLVFQNCYQVFVVIVAAFENHLFLLLDATVS